MKNLNHSVTNADGSPFMAFITKAADSHLVLAHAAEKQKQSPGTFSLSITHANDDAEVDEDLPRLLNENW
jgi:hypothetical protein